MKKIILIGVLLLSSIFGYSQDGAAIIASDQAINAVRVAEAAESLNQAKQAFDLAKKAKKALEAFAWLKNLKSADRTIQLLSNVYCNSELYSKYIRCDVNYNTCWGNIQAELISINLQTAMDLIYVVLTEGYSMTQGERIKTWNDALDKLERAERAMRQRTIQLRYKYIVNMKKKYSQQKRAEYTTARRRYNQ